MKKIGTEYYDSKNNEELAKLFIMKTAELVMYPNYNELTEKFKTIGINDNQIRQKIYSSNRNIKIEEECTSFKC